MAQQIINTGAVANDGTGDPLRTAFTETNSNFTEIYTAGPVGSNVRIANNTILTINTNGNLVLAPNGIGVVQSNVNIVPNQANVRNLGSSTARWGTIYAKYVDITNGTIYSGDLTVSGNLFANAVITPELTVNTIRSDDSTVVNIQDGVEVDGDILANGNVTADYVLGDGSQLLNIPVGNNGAVQVAWLGKFSNQGGTPDDTYSTLQFDSNGMPTLDGTDAYQQRVDYSPYLQVLAPEVESTDYDIIAGPGITVVGYDDNYNTPRSAYLSVQDQANATQQWDFGILGNGSNNFSIQDRTGNQVWSFGTDGNINIPGLAFNINYANSESATLSPSVGNSGAVQFNWQGSLSNQGGTPGDTYSTMQFDSDGLLNVTGTTAYQPRVDYTPYVTVNTPRVESTDFDIVAGPGITVVGYDDNYNIPRSAYLSVQDQATATQQWDFGILGNGSNAFSVRNRTASTIPLAISTDGYLIADGSQLLNIPVGNNGAVQVAWLGKFSNQGGTPDDTYSTLQFDSNGMPTLDGTDAYQQRVDYSPYLQVLAPEVESTDFDIVAGPGITVVGYDDNYNIPRSAYMSVQDQATATQQWDFGILGNGSNAFSVRNRTASTIPLVISTDGTVTASTIITNDISSDDSSFVTIQDGLNVVGDIETRGNVTADYFIGDGSQLLNIPVGNNGAVQVAWLGKFSNQGGTPDDTYSTLQFDSDGMPTLDGTSAYQQRVDYSPYLQVLAPEVESTDFDIVAGPGITVVGYDDNYNIPRSAYMSVQDQANATQQWDFGILGNGSNNYSISDRTNSNTWTFGITGDLSAPGNVTADYFIGDGSQLTNLPGGGNTGNVTFDDQAVVGTGDQVGSSGLYLAPGNASVGNLQYIRVRGGDVATHIHLDTGNNAYFDQYFGSDIKYVKLEAAGNVVIGSDDDTGNSAQWTFETGGNLTFPTGNLVIIPDHADLGNSAVIASEDHNLITLSTGANGGLSSLWVEDLANASSNIAAVYANPVPGSGNVRIAVGPNGGAGPNLWDFQPNGNLSIPGNINFSGDSSAAPSLNDFFSVTSAANFAIVTDNANTDQTWTFGTDGSLTLPIGVSIDYTGNIQYPKIIADSGKLFSIQGQGNSGSAALAWTVNPDAASQYAAVAVNRGGGDNLAKVVLTAQANSGDSANAKTWTFNEAGNLTLPGNTFAVNYANGTQVSLGGGSNTDWANIGNINNGNGPTQIAIGAYAGLTTQGTQAVAIGINAGITTQGNNSVAIGPGAGATTQGTEAVAIGTGAGETSQGNSAVAVGYNAGLTSQGNNAVAVGQNAGHTSQGINAVAIGYLAGNSSQGVYTVAIGNAAGQTSQGSESIAIGSTAGKTTQGAFSVAVGLNAGRTSQGSLAVALGYNAGLTSQGQEAVAIGYGAGQTSQATNSIILNATGAQLNQTTANTFTVAPVRNDVANTGQVMFYNTTSKEITYGNVINVAGNITAANFFGNGNTLSNVATTFESTWTVPVGNSTQSFTVNSGTYSMWVDCNIPNGILVWNATASITNTNVPVVGYQYAWVYNGGGTPIDFTSIPNQFIGTANAIVRSNVSPSSTTNRFDFGINNTSGGNVTVRYGWVQIS